MLWLLRSLVHSVAENPLVTISWSTMLFFLGQAVIVDPKGERGGWKENLPEIADEINILNLTSKPENQGLLDPYVIMKKRKIQKV